MARERMTILFDQAKKCGALVLGTSNKTEILLGYSTVFGDNASSLNPLGDLYKQQIWQLSRHLGLPERWSPSSPRRTSGPGRRTRATWASTTPRPTRCSTCSSTRACAPDEVVERGYAERGGRADRRARAANRFKRRLMLIARLSGSAVNLDREIPREIETVAME